MSIQGNNGFLDLENASLRVTGNVHAEGFKVGSVRLQSAYSLQSITGVSNVTNDMIQFTNPTKSFDATSNIEVGNGNLFVNTTTSNVGIGTNMPTSTLDVRGDASVSGNTSVSGNVSVGEVIGLSFGNIPTINFDQVSNVSQIKSNSNVVMEYKLSTRDYETKEPRIALTTNSDRGYVASASKEESTSRQAWKIFNNVQAEVDGWRSTSSDIEYNASGTYVGSSNLGTGAVNGEWVQIQLPYKIKLERFTLQPRVSTPIVPGSSPSLNYGRSEFIKNGKIYGSNDGVSWSLVHTITGISASTDTSIVSVIVDSSSAYYKYFGLVITDTNTSSASAAGTALSEWELYGTPFTANVATGTDVVLHTTPNVPKLDLSNVYYDGQDYTSMPATVADKSGNGVTGTPSGGVGFDSTYKAFTFDGVDDQITATLTNPAGAWVHSASMWFKVNSLGATNTLFSIDNDTTGENNRTPIFDIHTDGNLRYEFWDNAIYFGGEGTIVPNKWYHLSTTYSGGSDAPSRKVFLNGVELGISSTSGSSQNTALNAHANAILKIGVYPASTFPFNGSIANFRLYNQALSADEIWELYAYQKEYFGVSPDVVTLKAGRLGIGTSEPRAVLDVRGGITKSVYNPGEIIEELNSICDGSIVVVKSGSYTMTDITAAQSATTSYTEVTGSAFSYTPPPGTKRVYYRFWFHWDDDGYGGISHFKPQIDGNDIYAGARCIAAQHSASGHGNFPTSIEYTIDCNATTTDTNAGKFTAWTSPKTLRIMFREYGGGYGCRVHVNNWFNGVGGVGVAAPYLVAKPHLTIRAIA